MDASLKAGAATETVNVEGGAIGVVTTDASNIEANRTGQELVDLPVAIYSRSNGSTSPISTLTTQPGVQTDGSTLVIAGTTSALTAVTLDGISTMSIEYAGPINELFPSFNSISEMKVSGRTITPSSAGWPMSLQHRKAEPTFFMGESSGITRMPPWTLEIHSRTVSQD